MKVFYIEGAHAAGGGMVAKFFTRVDADAHMASLDMPSGWKALRIVETDEEPADQHPAHAALANPAVSNVPVPWSGQGAAVPPKPGLVDLPKTK